MGRLGLIYPEFGIAPHAPVDKELIIPEVQIGISEEEDIGRISESAYEFDKEVSKKIALNH
ncbi:MAG: hypothetical protein ACI9BF_000167 [Candidatus Paceibacteria bacterium]|jgi:hypothetical protein